jgi:sugar O-acyltransferase (sialic acid O-acetyltransferase NeuD family)
VKRLLLLGAGGLARETLEAVRDGRALQPEGFLDDAPELAGKSVSGLPVLGPTTEAPTRYADRVFVATVASPRDPGRRPRLVDRLALAADRWTTVVHPSACLAGSTRIGAGSVVLAACVATADVTIGGHVVLMPGCILTHDDVLEDYATLASGVRVSGGVTIESEAYVGAGALIREGLRIGRGALVGMGAVVTRDVPPGETWVGVPARRL